jgi:hypothetical protein
MKQKVVANAPGIQAVRQQQIDEGIDLGMWLGRRQAFALVAGRCSAADAECIREVRRNKRYRALRMTWEQFCEERLGITFVTANKIVRQLAEFGPEFFTLTQLTHVTAEEYRRLRPAVRGHALLHAGEEIPIEAENGPRLAAAIEELRQNSRIEAAHQAEPAEASGGQALNQHAARDSREIPAEPAGDSGGNPAGAAADATRAIAAADRSLHIALTEFERLQSMKLDLGDRLRLHSLVGYGAHKFNLLQLAVRL